LKPSLKDSFGAVRCEIIGYPALLKRRRKQVRSWPLGKKVGKRVQESDYAEEEKSETAEVGKATECEHCSGIVENISSWVGSVEIVVCLWSVYAPT
jgi:hypothetical protein